MLFGSAIIIAACMCMSAVSSAVANDCGQRLTDLEQRFDRLDTSFSNVLKMVCDGGGDCMSSF